MKKILFIAALVVALCLATAAANGAAFTDKDVVTFGGRTGYASLAVQNVSFRFDNIQPGECFATYWWIKNDGPCPLTVTVTVTGPNWLDIKFYSGAGYNFKMGPNRAKQVALTVRMPNWASTPGYANVPFTITVTFNSVEDGNRFDKIPPVGNLN